jgi:hypothetical protein
VFDDPVYLQKLESFLRAFGARYDGRPWLRYVDIGSIGDWGEGHTSSGSMREYDYDQRRIHVDLHLKYFPSTQLMITDDFVYCIRDRKDRQRMHEYVVENGIGYRDDSILVDWYVGTYSTTQSVRSPEFFADAFRHRPTVLELEHYSSVKRHGNWLGKPGSSLSEFGDGQTGADYFRKALARLHATYIGYHGFAHEWLLENPELTVELLNRCGYWYFLHRVGLTERWKPGSSQTLSLTWENRGVAPAYHPYELRLRLEGPETFDLAMDSGNRSWWPDDTGKTYTQSHQIDLPPTLAPGQYKFKLKLRCPDTGRDVLLALNPALLDANGFYDIARVTVGE